ncbi:MAG: small multi-drug export protein [Methanophagales archaeon]|nr:small multi-drug export protein [Methanophagales archaeon]
MTFDIINVLPESIRVILIAMIPIGELRASIPFAIGIYEMDPIEAYGLSVIGNMLPVAPLLLFLDPVSNWLRRYTTFDRFFNWLFSRTRGYNYNNRLEKYGSLALIPFVAIPVPWTGAWTACAIAFVFGIRHRHAFSAIFAGVMIAGIIVTVVYLFMEFLHPWVF